MDMLDKIYNAVQDAPRINEMCPQVGISWEDVKELVRLKAGQWDVRGQNVLNILMLGAAIGYLFGSGKKVEDEQPTN